MSKFIIPSTILISKINDSYVKLYTGNEFINRDHLDDLLSGYPYEYDVTNTLNYFIHVYDGDLKVSDKYRFVKFGGMEFV